MLKSVWFALLPTICQRDTRVLFFLFFFNFPLIISFQCDKAAKSQGLLSVKEMDKRRGEKKKRKEQNSKRHDDD